MAGDIAVDIAHLVNKIGLASSVREGRTLLGQGSILVDGRRLVQDTAGRPILVGIRDGSIIQRGPRKFKRLKFV